MWHYAQRKNNYTWQRYEQEYELHMCRFKLGVIAICCLSPGRENCDRRRCPRYKLTTSEPGASSPFLIVRNVKGYQSVMHEARSLQEIVREHVHQTIWDGLPPTKETILLHKIREDGWLPQTIGEDGSLQTSTYSYNNFVIYFNSYIQSTLIIYICWICLWSYYVWCAIFLQPVLGYGHSGQSFKPLATKVFLYDEYAFSSEWSRAC